MKKVILWILLTMLAVTALTDISLVSHDCYFEGIEIGAFNRILYANNDYLFKLCESTDGNILNIYSIYDLDNIRLVCRLDLPDNIYTNKKYRTFRNYVLIENEYNSIVRAYSYIIDLSNESDIHLTDFGYDFRYRDFFVDEPFIYAAVDSDGVAVFDINTMELITTSEYPFPVKEVAVYDSLLFTTIETSGNDNIIISNNSDIFNPIMTTSISDFTNVHKHAGKYYVSRGKIKGDQFQTNLTYKSLDLSEFPRVSISNIHSNTVYYIDSCFAHSSYEREDLVGGGTVSGPEYEYHTVTTAFINSSDLTGMYTAEDDEYSFTKDGYLFVVDFYNLEKVFKIETDTLIRISNYFHNHYLMNDNYIFMYTTSSPDWVAYELHSDASVTSEPTDTNITYIIYPEIFIRSESPFQSELQIQADFADYISITDVSGRIVKEFEFDSNQSNVTWTPDEDLPTGAYLVTARNDKAYQTKMVVYLKR